METDINRLKRHYSEIFNNLDEDCKKRILEIDKAAFVLSRAREKLIKQPYLKGGVFSLQEITDTTNSNNLTTIARLRSKVSNVINVMTNSAWHTKRYLADVNNFSENIFVENNQISYMPVIFTEKGNIDVKSQRDIESFCSSNFEASTSVEQDVKSFVFGVQAEKWKKPNELDEHMIQQSFNALAEEDLNNSQKLINREFMMKL